MEGSRTSSSTRVQQLYVASFYGELERVRALVEREDVHINAIEPKTGCTPLIAATKGGNLEVVRYLVSEGANMFQLGESGFRAVDVTPTDARLECLEFLRGEMARHPLWLESLAPLFDRVRKCELMEEMTLVSFLDGLISSESLDVRVRDVKRGETLLHVAARRNFVRVVRLLLRHGADPNAVAWSAKASAGVTPLQVARAKNSYDAARLLEAHAVKRTPVSLPSVSVNGDGVPVSRGSPSALPRRASNPAAHSAPIRARGRSKSPAPASAGTSPLLSSEPQPELRTRKSKNRRTVGHESSSPSPSQRGKSPSKASSTTGTGSSTSPSPRGATAAPFSPSVARGRLAPLMLPPRRSSTPVDAAVRQPIPRSSSQPSPADDTLPDVPKPRLPRKKATSPRTPVSAPTGKQRSASPHDSRPHSAGAHPTHLMHLALPRTRNEPSALSTPQTSPRRRQRSVSKPARDAEELLILRHYNPNSTPNPNSTMTPTTSSSSNSSSSGERKRRATALSPPCPAPRAPSLPDLSSRVETDVFALTRFGTEAVRSVVDARRQVLPLWLHRGEAQRLLARMGALKDEPQCRTVAVLGATHQGKSTLVRLLMEPRVEDMDLAKWMKGNSRALTDQRATTSDLNVYVPTHAPHCAYLDAEGDSAGRHLPVEAERDARLQDFMREIGEKQYFTLRRDAVREHLPRLSYAACDVVVLVSRLPLADTRYFEYVHSVALSAVSRVSDAFRPALLLVHNMATPAEAEPSADALTAEFFRLHDPEQELLRFYSFVRFLCIPAADASPSLFASCILSLRAEVSLLQAKQERRRAARHLTLPPRVWATLVRDVVDRFHQGHGLYVAAMLAEGQAATSDAGEAARAAQRFLAFVNSLAATREEEADGFRAALRYLTYAACRGADAEGEEDVRTAVKAASGARAVRALWQVGAPASVCAAVSRSGRRCSLRRVAHGAQHCAAEAWEPRVELEAPVVEEWDGEFVEAAAPVEAGKAGKVSEETCAELCKGVRALGGAPYPYRARVGAVATAAMGQLLVQVTVKKHPFAYQRMLYPRNRCLLCLHSADEVVLQPWSENCHDVICTTCYDYLKIAESMHVKVDVRCPLHTERNKQE